MRRAACTVVPLSALRRTDSHEQFLRRSALAEMEMNGFWLYSTERFFVVEEVMRYFCLTDVVHLENDVLLYSSVDRLLPTFREKYCELGLTQDHDNRVIGGFVYIPSAEAITRLNEYIITDGDSKNDMESLCGYLQSRQALPRLNLPVAYPQYVNENRLVNSKGERPADPDAYANNFLAFQSVFDAASLGQYVGGIDKMHSNADTRGFINETAYFVPRTFDIRWTVRGGLSLPYLFDRGQEVPVVNLHIHSKELRRYVSKHDIEHCFYSFVLFCRKALFFVKRIPWKTYSRILHLAKRAIPLLKLRPSSKVYISGDSFRSLAAHVFDETKCLKPENIRESEIVFVKSDYLRRFFSEVHPRIKHPYVLISHNSDESIDESYLKYVDDKIIHWYTQNLLARHPKISALPIGLENIWHCCNGIPIEFDLIRRMLGRVCEKKPRILMSFSIANNRLERELVYRSLKNHPLVDADTFGNPWRYKKALKKYMFVLSPPGNGFDCYRTWEAMCLRVVPIVKRSIINEQVELPCLCVSNWNELDELSAHDLSSIYYRFYPENKDNSHAFFPYWRARIEKTIC